MSEPNIPMADALFAIFGLRIVEMEKIIVTGEVLDMEENKAPLDREIAIEIVDDIGGTAVYFNTKISTLHELYIAKIGDRVKITIEKES